MFNEEKKLCGLCNSTDDTSHTSVSSNEQSVKFQIWGQILLQCPAHGNAFPSNIGLLGKEFAKLSQTQFLPFFGYSPIWRMSPNPGEINCGWDFFLQVRLNWAAPADTLAKIGNIMNFLFASCLNINTKIAFNF